MTFDYLTLTGVLFTLPYIVLLVMFSRHRTTSKRDAEPVAYHFDNEPYGYGVGSGGNSQAASMPCNSFV